MSKQDFQKMMDELIVEAKGIEKVQQIADKVNQEVYETSIEPVILRAAEKGLYEVSIDCITLNIKALVEFLQRTGYRVEVGLCGIIKVSWH